jgi:squalene-hopene/tetraprenyl-beta-curcumene cyclase
MNQATEAAIAHAADFLLAQAEDHFSEVRHTMIFPRAAGFSAEQETQSSDVFARAVLGSVLAEMASLSNDVHFASEWRALACREADHVAASRVPWSEGGWSYFADLPELPPDVDSLGAALELFVRTEGKHAPLCNRPIALALASQSGEGSLETWIVPQTSDAPSDAWRRERMRVGVENYWGGDRAVDVCARFFRALALYDADHYRTAINAGMKFVVRSQRDDGGWGGSWYGDLYTTALCADLMKSRITDGARPLARAVEYVLRTQRDDGGWGARQSLPLDTAMALWILRDVDESKAFAPIVRGLGWLRAAQKRAGFWTPSPWIRMEVGRAQGQISHTLHYQSVTLTTAFCMRTLLHFGRSFVENA